MEEKIISLVEEEKDALVTNRRDIHEHAESGWTEFRTAAKVVEHLLGLGYDVFFGKEALVDKERMGVPSAEVLQKHMEDAVSEGANADIVSQMEGGYTAVIGIMKFPKPGATVALRFDMDCNDVNETASRDHYPNKEHFSSLHPNCMHACGHDGHTAVGMSLARVLSELQGELCGTVKLIFQPAEEGTRGARSIAASGIVDDVDYMLGSHVMKGSTEYISYDIRGLLATTKFDAEFTGVAAHAGAFPEYGKNAMMAAVTATSNIMGIPRHSGGASRINVGVLEAGTGRNVIPDHALMKVETRGATTAINEYIRDFAYRILEGAAKMYDVTLKLTETGGAAGASNSPELVKILAALGDKLQIFKEPVPFINMSGSDDFSYYMERVQERGGLAAYIVYGGVYKAVNHNPEFDFHETVLPKILHYLASAVIQLLQTPRKQG